MNDLFWALVVHGWGEGGGEGGTGSCSLPGVMNPGQFTCSFSIEQCRETTSGPGFPVRKTGFWDALRVLREKRLVSQHHSGTNSSWKEMIDE